MERCHQMSYKLFTDKNENFSCEVSVKNASLKGSIARLVVESADGTNLIFNGTIEKGKCNIPIKRLKGLLEESSSGKLSLEIIVEDTYFKPWQTDFTVESSKTVKVKIDEQVSSTKPEVKVKIPESKVSLHPAVVEIYMLCEKFGINLESIVTKSTLKSKKASFRQLVKEYFSQNSEYNKEKSSILKQLSLIMR